jgi:hypothetical protein
MAVPCVMDVFSRLNRSGLVEIPIIPEVVSLIPGWPRVMYGDAGESVRDVSGSKAQRENG